MNTKTIEIIIVNYNSSFWLKKALDSIYKYFVPYSKYSILITVIDNASSDDSIEMIEKNYRQVNLIKSDRNVGFSAGNNIALKKSNADYIMLLNSDTELTEKSKNLDTLIDIIEKDNSIGMITPKLSLSDGQIDKACHRGEPSILDCFLYFAGFEKIFPNTKFFTHYHLLYKDLNSTHQVDAITGACMITKLKYFKEVDFFDERFFMYSEDMDLCRKYREKGYKILFNPTVEIIHHKYKSGLKSKDKKTSKKIKKHFYNSFLLYYDKWYNEKFYYKILRPFLALLVKVV